MNIIKKIYAVMECPKCKARSYFFIGDEEVPEGISKFEHAGYDNEDMKCYHCEEELMEIEYDKWNAGDIAEIFGDELEDRNYHRFTNMPDVLLNSLMKARIKPEKCDRIMKSFMEEMTKDWK